MQDLPEIIEWFNRPAADREDRSREIQDQLLSLWEQVRQEIGVDRFDPVLGTVRAGKFGSRLDSAWTQTNAEHPEGDLVNLTLELDGSELSLNVVGWFDPQLEKVERWLRTGAARKLLPTLGDWEVLIFVRHGKQGKNGRTMFRGAPGKLRDRFPVAGIAPSSIPITLSGLRPRIDAELEKLSLHLRRSWGANELSDLDIARAVADQVDQWLAPLEEIRLA
jgi:hypothetical protein